MKARNGMTFHIYEENLFGEVEVIHK